MAEATAGWHKGKGPSREAGLLTGLLVLFYFIPFYFVFVPLQCSPILRLVDEGMSHFE